MALKVDTDDGAHLHNLLLERKAAIVLSRVFLAHYFSILIVCKSNLDRLSSVHMVYSSYKVVVLERVDPAVGTYFFAMR